MNFRYPVFLDLTNKKCIVTGEGHEVEAKIRALIESEAKVVYVNSRAEPGIHALAAAGSIQWERRLLNAQDLDDCFLVITSLPDNSEVFRLAEERRILCNAADDPEHCRFSFGSVHRQGDLTIAISTNGWAPALAVRLRERFGSEIGPEYGRLLALLKEVRSEITTRITDFDARRNLWYRIIDSDVLTRLRDGDEQSAARTIRDFIEQAYRAATASERSSTGC